MTITESLKYLLADLLYELKALMELIRVCREAVGWMRASDADARWTGRINVNVICQGSGRYLESQDILLASLSKITIWT